MVKPASQRARHANQHLHPHHIRRKTAAVAVAACFTTGVAFANPTAPTVVHGTAAMSQAGGILNITNSHNAIINWGSFSIGVNELTRFIQPSALSAVLNRVVGSDPSAILGALQSNGRVFLLNPNGIVFGSGAQINVAGLVASTLNLSNDDFLNNRMRFTDGAGAGSVVNQGNITGGSVYLIGNAVANKGLITSPNGEVVLAAGNSVELVNPGTPNLRVEVVAPANEAVNLGSISAEAGRIGIYAGLVKQGGTINADSAVAEGGRIMLKSTKSTVIEAGSVTTARGTSGGQIVALSGMTDGKTEVAGKMDASAIASGTPGAGGFIETSAAKVKIADSAVINAAGSGGGKAGTWLIDPTDFYISNAYGGDMTATFLSSTLGSYGSGTNVDVFSTSGYGGSAGTIFVNDAVTWSTDSTLRLIAVGGVDVNSAITNTGTGAVKLYAGWIGTFSGSTPDIGFSASPTRNINLNAPISTLGEIHLVAYGNIIQGGPGSLTADKLLAFSQQGSVNLANPSATNTVNTIAGSAIGQFAFNNTGDLTIGSVGGVNGITVNGTGSGLHATADVAVTGGSLTVDSPIAVNGAEGAEGAPGGNANISLSATNGIAVNANVIATAAHGAGASTFSFASAGTGGNATINLSNTGATSDIVIGVGAVVQANGGGGGDGYWLGAQDGARGGDATVTITSARNVTVNGRVEAFGGHGGFGSSGVGGRGGDGAVNISATGGDLTIASSGGITASGGTGGSGDFAVGGRGGDATVTLAAYGGLTVTGRVAAYGGWGSTGDSFTGGRGGDAVINLTAGGALTIDSTIFRAVYAEGGEGGFGWWGGNGGRGGDATINLTSGGPMTLGVPSSDSPVFALGGRGGYVDGGEFATGGDGGNASIVALSAGGITVSGSLVAEGGRGRASFSGSSGYQGRGGNGTISLTNTSAVNPIDVLNSIDAIGGTGQRGGDASVTLTSNGGISIGSGVTASGGSAFSSQGVALRGGDASIVLNNTSTTAPLTINNVSVSAWAGGASDGSGFGLGDGGNATVLVNSAGGINHFGYVEAVGGDGYRGGVGGNAFVQFTTTNGSGINVEGEIYAYGGSGGFSSVSNGGAGGNAEIQLISSGGITLDAVDFSASNYISARGGRGGSTNYVTESGANGGDAGSSTILIQNTSTTAPVVINMQITADGSEGGNGSFGGALTSLGGHGGDASITISSASGVDIYSNGQVSAMGGSGGWGSYTNVGSSPSSFPMPGGLFSTGGRGGDASVSITAAGGITIAGVRGVYASGGRGGIGGFSFGVTTPSGSSSGSSNWLQYSGTGGRGGHASMFIQAGNGISMVESTRIEARAGDGGGNSTGTLEIFGDGGNATVVLNNTGSAAPINLNSFSSVNAVGGDGGRGGDGSIVVTSAGGINTGTNSAVQAWGGSGTNGGRGGSASVQLTSTSTSAGITIDGGEVYAEGGSGGFNNAGPGGRGGDASITIASAGGILVKRFVGASGGSGGSASSAFAVGNGGNASIMFSNTSTTAPIAMDGFTGSGFVRAEGGWGLAGGNADVAMTSAAGFVLQGGQIVASGGTGNAAPSVAGQGGTASIVLTNTNAGAAITVENSYIAAAGGSLSRSAYGGGVGGDAVVILSSAGGITLPNGMVYSSGGYVSGSSGAATDRGGAGALTMLAGGNISIDGGEGAASGGGGQVGGSAAINVIAGGNILIDGTTGFGRLYTSTAPGASASVVVAAAGTLTMNEGEIYSSGMAGLGGANILIDSFSSVWGASGVQVDASGSLTVTNGSTVSGGGNANITTGGNVVVDNNGLITGFPDVVMKVGGEVFIDTGGQIHAGMPSTIYLTFPMLESGGYTVNGIPGLVFDGSTGFFAGGSGAILGTNLLVTYGGGASLVVPTDTLIVAMSESIKPPDAEKKKDIFEDENDVKKKKETASCR